MWAAFQVWVYIGNKEGKGGRKQSSPELSARSWEGFVLSHKTVVTWQKWRLGWKQVLTGEAAWTKEWTEQKTSPAGNWVALGQWIYHTFSLQTALQNCFGKSLKLHYIWAQSTTAMITWAKFNEQRRLTYDSHYFRIISTCLSLQCDSATTFRDRPVATRSTQSLLGH